MPRKGATDTLDIASWNLEWFGDESRGPSDEALQRSQAREVILGADIDLWGVAEIASASAFAELTTQLPGYESLLANDPRVSEGALYYSDFDDTEQKVGILFKRELAQLLDARVILTGSDYAWAGRPPLQVRLRVSLAGHSDELVLIVLHAKCCDDAASWTRRRDAASALKAYLDSAWPSQKVWVVGDFNDDLDTSITPGKPSPYASFLQDSAHYTFASLPLSQAGLASTASFPDLIDQHLLSDEAAASYLPGSAEIYRVDQSIPRYAATTSDHFPLLSRYAWPGATQPSSPAPAETLVINEILANEPGSRTAEEFVELLNLGDSAVDLAGYSVSDSSAVRHVFEPGSTLPAGAVVVIFAGAASSGGLQLNNDGDSVTLRNAAGLVVQTVSYSAGQVSRDGVSLHRTQDGSFISGSASPGVRTQ